MLSSQEPLRIRTRATGIFLFLPLLAELKFDTLVNTAGYPGTKMIPGDAALLSLLALKLLRKERLSHIDDYSVDEGLGLFAALNMLPKKSFATDYSYRTQRSQQEKLLGARVKKLSPILLPEAKSFSLDFHPIPYRGNEAVLENHYIPCRGQACPSVQTFFAQEHEKQVFCYANANLTRNEQTQEVLRFADYWKDLTGTNPAWLYFDSKLTTYADLSDLNTRGIFFATIRRCGSAIMKRLRQLPGSAWKSATIDIPKRRNKHIHYLAENVSLDNYEGTLRQIAVKGLGREQPTLFLTNHPDVAPREMIMNYARRNGIEDGLGTTVNFFHMDNHSSFIVPLCASPIGRPDSGSQWFRLSKRNKAKITAGKGAPDSLPEVAIHAPAVLIVAGRYSNDIRVARIAVILDWFIAVTDRKQNDAPLAVSAMIQCLFNRSTCACRESSNEIVLWICRPGPISVLGSPAAGDDIGSVVSGPGEGVRFVLRTPA